MKILIADDTRGYNNAVSQVDEKKGRLQGALDAYTALGIATVPTTADLTDLWSNPKLFLERMLTGNQPVKFNGGALAVEPGKVYDLLDKPAGTDAFLATVHTLHNPQGSWDNVNVVPTQYELVAGAIQSTQVTLDNLREQYRLYATNQRQLDEWNALQTVATTLETIRQNGRFGANFNALEYLRNALFTEGHASAFAPVQANAAYIVQQAQMGRLGA